MSGIDKAVVIGGSMAGLATAATLSSRVREVVVVERRTTDGQASVAPQGHLPHVMLAAGARALEDLFPGFAERLVQRGAVVGGADPHRLSCYWPAAGAVRDHLRLPDLGFSRALCSRALVEEHLRAATLALPNVSLLHASVEALEIRHGSGDRVTVRGLALHGSRASLEADLVVDASGRNSRVESWLGAAGLAPPPHSEVVVDLRYTAFVVERRAEDLDGAAIAIVQNTPSLPRIGVALPMEGDRWQVVLGGYFGAAAPGDPAGARAFARSLSDPVLAQLLDRPQLGEPSHYTFRSSLHRHWDKAAPAPLGLCAVGDAVASFNPIYGQGMSSALLQAAALGKAVDRHGNDVSLHRAYARAAAKVVANPWLTATGSDLVYASTVGDRPPGNAFVNRYVDRVTRAAAVDETVNEAFTAVQQLLAAPPTLFRPGVVVRALRRGARSRTSPPERQAALSGRP
jgi:2-polyprenyl-6-methoxyphenol hydroxylase-like FAD-dependent oxidoreductase